MSETFDWNKSKITYEFGIQETNYLINALVEMEEDRMEEELGFIQLGFIRELREKIEKTRNSQLEKVGINISDNH